MAGLLARMAEWAAGRDDVRALALVGSHARGTAGPGSDVDLVLLTREPAAYVHDEAWIRELGAIRIVRTRSWGAVTERRLALASGLEVDVGVGTPHWAAIPVDPGTRRVVADGIRIVYDADGLLAALVREASSRANTTRSSPGPA